MYPRREPVATRTSRNGHRILDDDWQKPYAEKRILGRYAGTAAGRIVELPNEEDAGIDADGKRMRINRYTKYSRADDSRSDTGGYDEDGDARSAFPVRRASILHKRTRPIRAKAPEATMSLRGFVDVASPATKEIALLLMLRSWRRIAEAAQQRREELLNMWKDAYELHHENLLRRVVNSWKQATVNAMTGPGKHYESIQLKLAAMHYRQLLFRRAWNRLSHVRDIQQRYEEWDQAKMERLLVTCWIRWRVEYSNKRSIRLSRTADRIERMVSNRSKVSALANWRKQAQFARLESTVHEVHKRALLRQAWNILFAGNSTGPDSHQLITNGSESTALTRRFDGTEAQGKEQAGNVDSLSRLRDILGAWRQNAMAVVALEKEASQIYAKSLAFRAFDQLVATRDLQRKQEVQIGRFSRFYCLLRAMNAWRHRLRARRDNVLQTRAIRDLVRRRDNKRRRLLLAAWREVADRVVRAENRADHFIKASQTALVSHYLHRWLGACKFEAVHTGNVNQTAAQTAASLSAAGNSRAAPTTSVSVQAPGVAAGTVEKRDRAISIQTEEASFREREESEKRELMRRIRDAEEEVSRYKTYLVDPAEAKRAQIAREEELDGLLDEWYNRRSTLQRRHILRYMRNLYSKTRIRKDGEAAEQEQKLADEQQQLQQQLQLQQQSLEPERGAHEISNEQLRSMLLKWHEFSRICSDNAEIADNLYYDMSSVANQEVCYNAIFEWRSQLKDRRTYLKAAEFRYKMDMCRKLFDSMYNYWDSIRDMEAQANRQYYTMLMSRVWMNWVTTANERFVDRAEASDLNRDLEDVSGIFSDEGDNSNGEDAMPQEASAGPYALEPIHEQADDENLAIILSAWHEVVLMRRDIQREVLENLPGMFQRKAVNLLAQHGDDAFDWSIVHEVHLLKCTFKQWRERLASIRGSRQLEVKTNGISERATVNRDGYGDDGGDDDGPNAHELRRCEKSVSSLRKYNIKKDTMRKWVVACRGEILRSSKSSEGLTKAIAVMVRRAQLIKLARQKAPGIILKPMIRYWWLQFMLYCSRLENAEVQANASLVHMCIQRWLSATSVHRARIKEREQYMKAVAFRWESETRSALLRWMQASSDERIKVRLAEQAGQLRNERLSLVAEESSNARIARAAFRRLRAAARQRAMHHGIGMRLAAAWSSANIQRHALQVWKSRISPSSSMFFSMAGSVEGC